MIEKLNKEKVLSMDFMQDITNKKIIEKINEIIDYINNKEE